MPQNLVLEVSGRHAAQFGSRARRTFEGTGGSIGRSEDCDWVLSASGVSRVHAMIRMLNGMYFIEDRSTNGMLLNGAPLTRGDPTPLNDGDRLLIDSFEVECRMQDEMGLAAPASVPEYAPPKPEYSPPFSRTPEPMMPAAALSPDPFDFALFDTPPRAATPVSAPIQDSLAGDLISDWNVGGAPASDLDPLSFLGALDGPGALAPGKVGGGLDQGWNHSAGTADHFRPPSSMSLSAEHRQTSSLPENWDLTMGDFAPKKPAPPAAPPSKPVPPAASPMARPAYASEPAVSATSVPAEIDQIFRVVVDGVMDVLRARAEIKNTFRLPVTIIQRSENNPLKFAPNVDEALQKILAPPSAAFLSGTAAFQDAFDDIRCHQMAMLAGVRAAFESLLAHFSPERFEQEADGGGGKRAGFMDFAAGKGKYWERYRDNFEGLNRNPDEAFRRLFGDEFARAYEEQLSRLKSARRMQQSMQR